MVVAIIILFVLAVAQQIFNAILLRALMVNRENETKLADSVSELADATLDLAKKILPKEKKDQSKNRRHPKASV